MSSRLPEGASGADHFQDLFNYLRDDTEAAYGTVDDADWAQGGVGGACAPEFPSLFASGFSRNHPAADLPTRDYPAFYLAGPPPRANAAKRSADRMLAVTTHQGSPGPDDTPENSPAQRPRLNSSAPQLSGWQSKNTSATDVTDATLPHSALDTPKPYSRWPAGPLPWQLGSPTADVLLAPSQGAAASPHLEGALPRNAVLGAYTLLSDTSGMSLLAPQGPPLPHVAFSPRFLGQRDTSQGAGHCRRSTRLASRGDGAGLIDKVDADGCDRSTAFAQWAEEGGDDSDRSSNDGKGRDAVPRVRARHPEGVPQTASNSSRYKGVSKHRLTGRWEASVWVQGRQLYLGGYDSEEAAAEAHDLAAIFCKGDRASTNFTHDKYAEKLKEVSHMDQDELVAHIRRHSNAFARGRSRYRGVSGRPGRWEARIGCFLGKKNVSFGVFEAESEAARQYDRGLLVSKGPSAKTNFPVRDYEREVDTYEAFLKDSVGKTVGQEVQPFAIDYLMPVGVRQVPMKGAATNEQVVFEGWTDGDPRQSAGRLSHDKWRELMRRPAKRGRTTLVLAEQLRLTLRGTCA